MKLIVITGAIFFDEEIAKILDNSGVAIYSRSNIAGHKKKGEVDLSENWFATGNGYQESVMFFAFTDAAIVDRVMAAVDKYNETLDSESPLRAFVLAVEKHN
jgi:hypothetical protein